MLSILDLSRMHDSDDLAGFVGEIAAEDVVDAGRLVVTAVRTAGGRLKLISWRVDPSGAIARLRDSKDQAGVASSIDICKVGTSYVTAFRTADGKLRLISWTVDDAGVITRGGDSGDAADAATMIQIVALGDSTAVTACRTAAGDLRLIAWRLNADGSLTRVPKDGKYAGTVHGIQLLDVSQTAAPQSLITVVRDASDKLKLLGWSVAADGITPAGDSGYQAGKASLIRAVLHKTGHVVTSVRDASGNLKLITWMLEASGAITRAGDSGAQAGAIGDNALLSLGDGVVSAVRTGDGLLKLIAWKVAASGAVTRRGDSGRQAGAASLLTLVAGDGIADAAGRRVSIITALRTASNDLKLISWGPSCLRLHFKVLTAPTISTSTMLASMRQVYATAGIGVTLVSTEDLNLPALNDLDVGECIRGSPTAEQDQLFAYRANAETLDIVVYFVRSTVPPLNGCASHPSGQPGAVVAQWASQWTMAHEVGHVLGLRHIHDNDRLMTGNGAAGYGTDLITNPPPDLVASEVGTMQGSRLSRPCGQD